MAQDLRTYLDTLVNKHPEQLTIHILIPAYCSFLIKSRVTK